MHAIFLGGSMYSNQLSDPHEAMEIIVRALDFTQMLHMCGIFICIYTYISNV